MRRRLFTGLSVLSLVVFGLALALINSPMVWRLTLFDGGGRAGRPGTRATYIVFADHMGIGIGWTHSDAWFEGEISAPIWMVLLISLFSTVIWVLLSRNPRHSPAGCPVCGYSLTGNTSGVCPECGTPTTVGVKA